MAPGIIRVLIVALVSFVAFAASYSTAAFARPARINDPSKYRTVFTAPARHLASIQQPAPQPTEIRLTPGKTLDQEISRDEIQSFAVELSPGQYAEVDFDWFGLNLGIAVLDPDGKKPLPNDSPLNSNGPLSISILADKGGIYRLNVKPIVSAKIRGKFQITLREPHLPTDEDRGRLEAQTFINQAAGAPPVQKVDAYGKAVGFLETAHDSNGVARTLMLLGDAFKASNDFPNAQKSYERAAKTWMESGNKRGEGYARVSLGLLNRSPGSLADAVNWYDKAHVLFRNIGDQRGQADALYGESFALMRLSQPLQAIALLEQQVLPLRRANGDFLGEVQAINMLADAYRVLGEADKSLELFDHAMKALDGLEQRSLEAAITNNKALINDDRGFWELAKEEYASSLNIYESILGQSIMQRCAPLGLKLPAPEDASICRSAATAKDNLGQVYTSLVQFDISLRELGDALSIWQALSDNAGQGFTILHIGYANFMQGRPRDALSEYQKALAFQRVAANTAGMALTDTYIGMAYASLGEPELALRYYKEALPLQQTAGDKRALAITLDNLGMAQELTGSSKDALTSFSSALTLWRSIKDPDGAALTLYHSGMVQAATGDLIAANQASEEAIKMLETLRSRLRTERLRAAYLADKQDYYKLDIDLKMRLSRSGLRETYVTGAFESNEKAKARVLLDSLGEADVVRSIRGKASSAYLETLREEQDALEKKLADKAVARTAFLSNKHTNEQVAAFDNDISQLSEKYDELEQAIKSEDPRFASLVRPQPASLNPIQQQLDSDTLLLEYSLGKERSYVWGVTSNSIEGFPLRPRAAIEAAANRITKSLADRNRTVNDETAAQYDRRGEQADKDFEVASAELSEMIIRPLASLLGNKRLVIVADGALQRVSFAALPLPRAGAQQQRRLIDDHEIVYEPSASVLALQRSELGNRKAAPRTVAILADPVFDKDDVRVASALRRINPPDNDSNSNGNTRPEIATQKREVSRALEDVGLERFLRLRSSATEAKRIMAVATKGDNKEALNFDASRETATSSDLSNYRIVHFATHAVVNYEHPELSGIVLSLVDRKGQPQDGYLRLHDIYNLNLPADLVVLSACQTGVGKEIKGEGLIALTRGFMYAGAERVVASLWKVDDVATADLMAEFYKQMFVNGQRPAAALRSAQMVLAKKHSPADWAGFVLQGEWK